MKFLNREITHESEVWVNDSRCVVLFRSQDATTIACVLKKPLPVTGMHLEQSDLDVVVRLATEADVEVVVLAPRTMIWPEVDDRQMHTQQPWSNRNPGSKTGIVVPSNLRCKRTVVVSADFVVVPLLVRNAKRIRQDEGRVKELHEA